MGIGISRRLLKFMNLANIWDFSNFLGFCQSGPDISSNFSNIQPNQELNTPRCTQFSELLRFPNNCQEFPNIASQPGTINTEWPHNTAISLHFINILQFKDFFWETEILMWLISTSHPLSYSFIQENILGICARSSVVIEIDG